MKLDNEVRNSQVTREQAALLEDLEVKVCEWHVSGEEEIRSLHEFLEMSWEEYCLYAVSPLTYVQQKKN